MQIGTMLSVWGLILKVLVKAHGSVQGNFVVLISCYINQCRSMYIRIFIFVMLVDAGVLLLKLNRDQNGLRYQGLTTKTVLEMLVATI